MGKKKKLKKKKAKSYKKTAPKKNRQPTLKDSLLTDLFSYFVAKGVTEQDEDEFLESILELVVESGILINEPEFQEVLFEPFTALKAMEEALEEKGLSEKQLNKLPEEASFALLDEIRQVCISRVYDTEFEDEFIRALKLFKIRSKKERNELHTAQATAILFIILNEDMSEFLSLIGLIQEIYKKSVGFAVNFIDMQTEKHGKELQSFFENEDNRNMFAKAAQKNSILSAFVEEESEKIWQDGVESISLGELYLGLFDINEIQDGLALIVESLPEEIKSKIQNGEDFVPEKKLISENFSASLNMHISKLLTPKRLKQFRKTIKKLQKETDKEDYDLQSFLLLVENALYDDIESVELRDFLGLSFLGELRFYFKKANVE